MILAKINEKIIKKQFKQNTKYGFNTSLYKCCNKSFVIFDFIWEHCVYEFSVRLATMKNLVKIYGICFLNIF